MEKQPAPNPAGPSSGNIVVMGPNVNPVGVVTSSGSSIVVPTFEPGILYEAGQEDCPVRIVNASFGRPAQLMLTGKTKADSGPTLHLDYRNLSGKDIESVMLIGWIKVKESPYQLDSVTHPFHLELSRKALLAKGVQATQTLNLANNALGLDRLELLQVTYADGTTWKPEPRSCVYNNAGGMERAEAR